MSEPGVLYTVLLVALPLPVDPVNYFAKRQAIQNAGLITRMSIMAVRVVVVVAVVVAC